MSLERRQTVFFASGIPGISTQVVMPAQELKKIIDVEPIQEEEYFNLPKRKWQKGLEQAYARRKTAIQKTQKKKNLDDESSEGEGPNNMDSLTMTKSMSTSKLIGRSTNLDMLLRRKASFTLFDKKNQLGNKNGVKPQVKVGTSPQKLGTQLRRDTLFVNNMSFLQHARPSVITAVAMIQPTGINHGSMRSKTPELTIDQMIEKEMAKEKRTQNDLLNQVSDVRILRKMKWDINSPRFKQACENFGIEIKELTLKKQSDFEWVDRNDGEGLSKELVSVRYNYHLKTLKGLLNKVIQERDRIKQGLKSIKIKQMRKKLTKERQQADNGEGSISSSYDTPISTTPKNVSAWADKSPEKKQPPPEINLTQRDMRQIGILQTRNDKFAYKLALQADQKQQLEQVVELGRLKHAISSRTMIEKEKERQYQMDTTQEKRDTLKSTYLKKQKELASRQVKQYQLEMKEAEDRMKQLHDRGEEQVKLNKKKEEEERASREIRAKKIKERERAQEAQLQEQLKSIEVKRERSLENHQMQLHMKSMQASYLNQNVDLTAEKAKKITEEDENSRFKKFGEKLVNYHEKLVRREENVTEQQTITKSTNEFRQMRHSELTKSLKKKTKQEKLNQIFSKQKLVAENKSKNDKEIEESWALWHEEEALRQHERVNAKARKQRQLESKKANVIAKMLDHEEKIQKKRSQEREAIELKRNLSQVLQRERIEIQGAVNQIQRQKVDPDTTPRSRSGYLTPTRLVNSAKKSVFIKHGNLLQSHGFSPRAIDTAYKMSGQKQQYGFGASKNSKMASSVATLPRLA